MPETISWFPKWTAGLPLTDLRLSGSQFAGWTCQRPDDQGWARIAAGLRAACDELRKVPIAEIIASLDRAAERWAQSDFPLRVAARESVARATGFSLQAVDESFDVELRNYRADSLWRALRREIGDPGMLDAFVPDGELAGSVRALGPRITLAVCTGNVPGLPALPLVRALLVKSAVIAKVASGEPTFARRFVESLQELDPRLAQAIVVTYWSREDTQTLNAVLRHTDAVIAYGSDEACEQVRAAVPPHQRFVEHGHKLSAGIVSSAFFARHGEQEVADRVARDTSVFNQHACIAPQVYFVQGTPDERRAFGNLLAGSLERYAARHPLGTLQTEDAAAIRLERAAHAWRSACEPELNGLWLGDKLQWTLTLETELQGARGLGNRFLRLIGIERLEEALRMLAPFGRHLQNIGLGVDDSELPELASALCELGASRLCAPGRMVDPSMMWRHDGRMCVAELLRFCDVEMHESPAEALTIHPQPNSREMQ